MTKEILCLVTSFQQSHQTWFYYIAMFWMKTPACILKCLVTSFSPLHLVFLSAIYGLAQKQNSHILEFKIPIEIR